MLDLSICIVTLNACDYLRNCLRSIREQPLLLWGNPGPNLQTQADSAPVIDEAGLTVEVIIVDNASSDGTISMLKSEFPAAQLIENDENMGFAHPINQALQVSQGQFLLLLNPDTVVLPGAINQLVQYQAAHPEVGICGPKVLNRDGTLQKACRRGVSRRP